MAGKPPHACAVHQPNLFPRLSTLAKLYASDRWVVLDNVQFVRRDYQHRCRVGTPGAPETHQWLSLPVHLPDGRSTPIDRVTLADPRTARRRLEGMLTQHYGRARHWSRVRDVVHQLTDLVGSTDRLADIALASTTAVLNLLDWPGTAVSSSTFDVSQERSARLADLTHAVGQATYLCGTGGARYLDEWPFHQRGIHVAYWQLPAAEPHSIWVDARRLTSVAAIATHGIGRVKAALETATARSGSPSPAR
ncbi:WbqC family protein [Actinopolymorpha sp. B17G11]|uniref:WbqC family protein n=1 Tax=unclassified Actinopolymorpha TaxID=2627063 RepID=UPI0032D8F8B3